MSGIEELYINALLADASYVDLPRGTVSAVTGSDLTKRMTQTLSTYIANNFTVVDSINSGEYFESGFDATVWREKSTGQIYISMRGAEIGLQDLFCKPMLN